MTAPEADTVDYLVLGGGSAGCVLAGRLSEDPSLQVALVEAGGTGDSWFVRLPLGAWPMIPTRINNWGFETVPQPGLGGRRGYQPRGRGLGGHG
jgi:choline dehydrogenase-like flavoprotein